MAASTPLQGKVKQPPKKTPTTTVGKAKGKPNGNIMNFFKRADSSGVTVADIKEEYEPLFLGDSPVKGDAKTPLQTPTPPREEPSNEASPEDVEMHNPDSPLSRYNEDGVPSKRRRIEDIPRQSSQTEETKAAPTRGPFVDDSDSEDEPVKALSFSAIKNKSDEKESDEKESDEKESDEKESDEKESEIAGRDITPALEWEPSRESPVGQVVPSLKRETTSVGEVNGFDGNEDFIDDEFPEEGEEYLERRWMEEQAQFEEGLEEENLAMEDDTLDMELKKLENTTRVMPEDVGSTSCPICGGNTTGLNDQV